MELNNIIEHFYYYACDRCKEEGLTDVIGDECRNTSCWAKKINKHLQSCKQLKAENEELKEKLKEVQKFLELHEVGECTWDDDCYYCKNASKDGKYFCYIGDALEVIRGEKQENEKM